MQASPCHTGYLQIRNGDALTIRCHSLSLTVFHGFAHMAGEGSWVTRAGALSVLFIILSKAFHLALCWKNEWIDKPKKITIMGETWQHISELESRHLQRKVTCSQQACRQQVTITSSHSLSLSQLWKAQESRSRRIYLTLFGLKNKKLLPSLGP